MAYIYHRPLMVNDFGQVGTYGTGNVLGDNNNSSYKKYYTNSGSVGAFPNFDPALLNGKKILAVKVGHRERNEGLFNGWVMSYLRIDGKRYEPSRAYKQRKYSSTWTEIFGAPVYKGKNDYWKPADIDRMAADIGAAKGDFGPNRSKLWCVASELMIVVITAEPISAPVVTTPSTFSTTNPELTAQANGVQQEQSAYCTMQVARNATFTNDVREYGTDYRAASAVGTISYSYKGVPGEESYADLGPGTWYIRAKVTDITGTVSGWSPVKSFSISLGALPTPTMSKPTSGSATPNPFSVRAAQIPTINNATYMPGERQVGVEFQFSRFTDFAENEAGFVTWTNIKDGIFTAGEVLYDPAPVNIEPGLKGGQVSFRDPSQKLPQGTVYARARAVDKWNNAGLWSAITQFSVSHKPYAKNILPTGGQDFDPVNQSITWEFADPWLSDSQGAYRITIKNATGTQIVTTGKVISPNKQAQVNIPDTYLGQTLTYEITLWDADDIQGNVVTSTFHFRRAPIVTVIAPTGEITDGVPTVTWSSVFSENKTQTKARIIIQNKTTGAITYDTQTLVTKATSHTIKTQLTNVAEFETRVYVYDSGGLMGMGAATFSTNFIVPPTLDTRASAERYSAEGYTDVYWDGPVDTFFYEFRIYRRMYDPMRDDPSAWALSGVVQDATARHFKDYMASGYGEIEYAVTQVSYRYGSTVESNKNPSIVSRTRIHSEDYWFIIPGNEENSVRLHLVTEDSFTDRVEFAKYDIVGGGTRVNKGSSIGMDGSLTCLIRSSTTRGAADQVKLLREIHEHSGYVLMRDPFGHITKVAIGEIQVKRVGGVGPNEFADITVPYTEVR